jgi:RimJ/RimL family protein N-acetyltransferase
MSGEPVKPHRRPLNRRSQTEVRLPYWAVHGRGKVARSGQRRRSPRAARVRGQRELTGWFGLRPVSPGSAPLDDWPDAPAGQVAVAALGYRLRRSVWGRGYAAEEARALVRRAFTELGVSRVATTMAVNARSRRMVLA